METLTKTTGEISLGPIIDALQEVYRDHLAPAVRETTGVDLPPAVFVVKRDARAWGHITIRPAWNSTTEDIDADYPYAPYAISIGAPMTTTRTDSFHEIMVSGENLARGARDVFGTVAHETAHAFNITKGTRDVDSNGRHNKKFKVTAEGLFGLTITEGKNIGWSVTNVSDECATKWAEAIELLERAIVTSAPRPPCAGFSIGGLGGFTMGAGPKGGTGRDKNLKKASCGCGSIIRTSLGALSKGITCGECGEEFTI